ncbi:ABC transporter substrate-binding protein, partial [Brevibacillus agri]
LGKEAEESVALILSWDGKTFNVLGEGNPVYTLAFDKEKGLGLTPDGAFQGTAMDTSAITGGPLAIEYALQNISTALRKL